MERYDEYVEIYIKMHTVGNVGLYIYIYSPF